MLGLSQSLRFQMVSEFSGLLCQLCAQKAPPLIFNPTRASVQVALYAGHLAVDVRCSQVS